MIRISGYLFIAVSFIHFLAGIWLYGQPLADIIHDGWFNAVAPNPFAPYWDREDAFWFMFLTPIIFALGQLCLWADKQKINLPKSIAWNLLITCSIGLSLEPVSGIWLALPPILLLLK
ncbi:MAG: DUF6463 family protein [Xenococcaceae cyanobacterium]